MLSTRLLLKLWYLNLYRLVTTAENPLKFLLCSRGCLIFSPPPGATKTRRIRMYYMSCRYYVRVDFVGRDRSRSNNIHARDSWYLNYRSFRARQKQTNAVSWGTIMVFDRRKREQASLKMKTREKETERRASVRREKEGHPTKECDRARSPSPPRRHQPDQPRPRMGTRSYRVFEIRVLRNH